MSLKDWTNEDWREWITTFILACLIWIATWHLGASITESITLVIIYMLGMFILYNQGILLGEIRNKK